MARPTKKATTTSLWFSRPGVWFWCAIALGAAIRVYLIVFTNGTLDVPIWEKHARNVHELGVIGFYHADSRANHPPFISEIMSLLCWFGEKSGIPFRILLRAPFALIDAGTTLLLLSLMARNRWRFLAAASYWVSPLAMIFSAYHGNTDCAVAFFLLLCVWSLSEDKTIGGGIALGASFWIKISGVFAIPALFFFVQGWRRRLIFISVAGVTALSTYLPALFQDPKIVYANVLGYRGLIIHTVAGVPVWGLRVLLFSIIGPSREWLTRNEGWILFLLHHSWHIGLVLLLILSWLRRSHRSAPEVCATVGMIYTIFYGFTDSWAFQYLAWSLPFWFFLRPWFFVPAICLTTAYIYSLYWVLCGNGWLLGNWDFVGHAYWPAFVMWSRDLTVLFFFISGLVFFVLAVREQIVARVERINSGRLAG